MTHFARAAQRRRIEPLRELPDVANGQRLHVAVRAGRHDGVDPRGIARRGQQRDGAAAAVSDQVRVRDLQVVEQRDQVGSVPVIEVRRQRRQCRRTAKAMAVVGDDAIAGRERVELGRPVARALVVSMKQNQRIAGAVDAWPFVLALPLVVAHWQAASSASS